MLDKFTKRHFDSVSKIYTYDTSSFVHYAMFCKKTYLMTLISAWQSANAFKYLSILNMGYFDNED